jgi:hypothetical protein
MSSPNEASRIIAAEAKTILAPMGLKQRGRSRVWLDDHGWWVGVVELQPSSWSKGSYLNVGCWFLWQIKDYISYDLGSRVEAHSKFADHNQFCPEAKRLAIRAGQEIKYWREQIPTVKSLCAYYEAQPDTPPNLWPDFDAAIANGLGGKHSLMNWYFDRIGNSQETDYEWVRAAKADAAQLRNIATDRDTFRSAIANRVDQCRALNKLPPLPNLNFDGQ